MEPENSEDGSVSGQAEVQMVRAYARVNAVRYVHCATTRAVATTVVPCIIRSR
jgi:hypothetical protein